MSKPNLVGTNVRQLSERLASLRAASSISLRRDQVGSKYARISGNMATPGAAPGGTHIEETPDTIRHASILDEAVLAKLDAQQTCVEMPAEYRAFLCESLQPAEHERVIVRRHRDDVP